MFTDIAITPMYVTDQDAALTFYCDKLGFVIDTDADLGNMRWLTVRLPAAPERKVLLQRHRLARARRPAARADRTGYDQLDDPGLRRRPGRP